MLKINIFIFTTLFFYLPLFGQVNIEEKREKELKKGVFGFVIFDGQLDTGNKKVLALNFNSKVTYQSLNNDSLLKRAVMFIGSMGLNKDDGGANTDNALAHIRFTQLVSRNIYVEIFTQYDKNKEQRLVNARFLAGVGSRIALNKAMNIGSGIMIEYEDVNIQHGDQHPKIAQVIRNSNYISFSSLIGTNASIEGTLYLQPKLSEISDTRSMGNIMFTSKMSNWFSLAVTYSYLYDLKPPQQVPKITSSLTVGLKFDF